MIRASTRLADPYGNSRAPGAVIAHTVWLYLRLPLSVRDVEEILADRGSV
jgi:putative transposase